MHLHRTYAGEFTPEGLVTYFPQAAFVLDINNDNIEDVIIPMNKGYAREMDTSTPFVALTSNENTLIFDKAINSTMPVTTASRRSEAITLVNSEYPAFVTIAHIRQVLKVREINQIRLFLRQSCILFNQLFLRLNNPILYLNCRTRLKNSLLQ